MNAIKIVMGTVGVGLIIHAVIIIISDKYFAFFSKVYFIEPTSEEGKEKAKENIKKEKNSQRYGLSAVSVALGFMVLFWSFGVLQTSPFMFFIPLFFAVGTLLVFKMMSWFNKGLGGSHDPLNESLHSIHNGKSPTFKGGLWTNWLQVTWPFISIKVTRENLTIRDQLFKREFKFTKSDVTQLKAKRYLPFIVDGIEIIHIKKNYDEHIRFWTFSFKELVKMLKEYGWPINE